MSTVRIPATALTAGHVVTYHQGHGQQERGTVVRTWTETTRAGYEYLRARLDTGATLTHTARQKVTVDR